MRAEEENIHYTVLKHLTRGRRLRCMATRQRIKSSAEYLQSFPITTGYSSLRPLISLTAPHILRPHFLFSYKAQH